ncbi:hypothetical protein Tco_0696584 [Tanacetum coccineum]
MTWHHETSLKVPHWLKPKRELHVGLTSSTSRTENLHYLHPMIEMIERAGLQGACAEAKDLEASVEDNGDS